MKALDKMWNGSGWYGFIWEKSTSTTAISLTKSWHPVQGFRPSYTHNKNVALQGPASMCRSRGGNRVSQPPPPENSQKIGFLSNTGPNPQRITKLPSQHSMLGHHLHASETLAGQ